MFVRDRYSVSRPFIIATAALRYTLHAGQGLASPLPSSGRSHTPATSFPSPNHPSDTAMVSHCNDVDNKLTRQVRCGLQLPVFLPLERYGDLGRADHHRPVNKVWFLEEWEVSALLAFLSICVFVSVVTYNSQDAIVSRYPPRCSMPPASSLRPEPVSIHCGPGLHQVSRHIES